MTPRPTIFATTPIIVIVLRVTPVESDTVTADATVTTPASPEGEIRGVVETLPTRRAARR